jgi:hypothetical protein
LDEGPIQNLLSFPNKKVDEKSIRQFLSSLPDSGEVILLTVAEEVRQRRLQQRPYVTWRQKQNSIINYDDVMKCNHDLLVSIVSVQERFNLIENNESTT